MRGQIAPKNSSIATEYAGENIPNNCFVSKKEGAGTLSEIDGSNVSQGIAAIKLNNGFTILVDWRGSDNGDKKVYLTSFKKGIKVAEIAINKSGLASNIGYISCAVVAFSNLNKILFMTKGGYKGIKNNDNPVPSYLINCDNDGNITYTSITVHSPASGTDFIVGGYASNNTFYAINTTAFNVGFHTFTFDDTSNIVTSNSIVNVYSGDVTSSDTVRANYLNEYNLIIFNISGKAGIINTTTNTLVLPYESNDIDFAHKTINTCTSTSYQSFYQKFITKDNCLYYFNSWQELYSLKLDTFTQGETIIFNQGSTVINRDKNVGMVNIGSYIYFNIWRQC